MNVNEPAAEHMPINMSDAAERPETPQHKKPWYRQLYVQVLIAIFLGVLVGVFFPDFATTPGVKALGDGFIKLSRW
jgi:hypothetical protein